MNSRVSTASDFDDVIHEDCLYLNEFQRLFYLIKITFRVNNSCANLPKQAGHFRNEDPVSIDQSLNLQLYILILRNNTRTK